MSEGIIMNERVRHFLRHFFDIESSTPQKDEADLSNSEMETTAVVVNFDTEVEMADDGRKRQEFSSKPPISPAEIDEKRYNKIGFYCFSDPLNDPKASFEKALADIEKEFADEIRQATEVYEHGVELIKKRIVASEKGLEEEHDNLAKHRDEIKSLREKREKILAEDEEIRKKLTATYQDLADKKRTLVEGRLKTRLEEVEKELQKLIENHQLLSEKKYEVNKRIFDDNKKVFDIKVERFTQLKKQGEQAYQTIRQKLEDLSRAGLTKTAVHFLSYTGVLGLIAAGWFYSVFILSTKIDSDDYLSFFLRRVITFGDAHFHQGNSLVTLLIFTGVFIGLLVLISAIVWACHKLVDERERGRVRNKIELNFNEDGKVAYYTQINARSTFTVWMQLVPYLLVVGLAFILISLFSLKVDNKDLDILLVSLSGQFMGGVIALAATGVMVLYISLVIEPRLLRQNESLTQRAKWTQHGELVTSIILFLLLMAFVMFSRNIVSHPSSVHLNTTQTATGLDVTIATAFFLIIVLFTAFTLGYGIKYQGLYHEARHLDAYLRNLSLAIEDNSRPVTLDTKSLRSKKFRKEFEACQEEFFKIIKERNKLVTQLFDNAGDRTPSFGRFKIFRKNGDTGLVENEHLSKLDRQYFPEITKMIDDLEAETQAKQAEAKQIAEKMKIIENRRSELEKTIAQKIQDHEARLFELREQLIAKEKEWHKQINGIKQQQKTNEGKMKDGYELGLLFRQKMSGQFDNIISGAPEAPEPAVH